MRSLILISKAVNTKRHALRKFIHNIIILILSIFIIAYFTGQFSNSRTVLMNLEHAKWDALITGSTFEQFNEKLNNANIKKVIGGMPVKTIRTIYFISIYISYIVAVVIALLIGKFIYLDRILAIYFDMHLLLTFIIPVTLVGSLFIIIQSFLIRKYK